MANPLYPASAISPARSAFAVTPNDGADLPAATKSLFVGTGGNLAVTTRNGDTVTFKNMANGQQIDIDAKRVMQTGTTAADIVGLG